jgi:hypothetical protein
MLETISIIVGVVSGVSGLVLGILNYRDQRDRTRPKLRVRPCLLSLIERNSKTVEHNLVVMEVCNVGNVAVMGSSIGFKPKRKGGKGHLIVSPESIGGERWPGELLPGRAAFLRMKLGKVSNPSNELGPAFASTIVGDTFLCEPKDMRTFLDDLACEGSESKASD